MSFADNFWETIDKNGIAILMERMRGAKQTCEKMKNAYEARAILEEHYGKTLMQIYQKQKISHTENGSSAQAMESMQQEMISIAESHIQLSQHIRNTVASPLSTLLNRQKTIKKELQTSIQKLYNNRQHRIQVVRKAHKRHNFEIEKANLLVQQQSDEKEKLNTFKTAKMTIDKLKKEYDQALQDLEKVVEEWNKEWKKTCQSFEDLEKERLEFVKTNVSNYAQLMIGCLEGEIKACEQMQEKTENINVVQDLDDFVTKNKSSQTMPTSMEYIKLSAYHEANGGTKEHKHDEPIKQEETPIQEKVVATKQISEAPVTIDNKKDQPVLMMGVMEVYPSDEEESDSEYVTESESEDEEQEVTVIEQPKPRQQEPVKIESNTPERTIETSSPEPIVETRTPEPIAEARSPEPMVEKDDEKVSKLRSAYQEIQEMRREGSRPGSNNSRRVSFIETSNNDLTHRSTLMDRYKRSVSAKEDYHTSAALELDDMLRELDSNRIHRQPDNIKPTVSISSPSLLKRPQYKPNQFESSTSRRNMDFYDPFNSLSEAESKSNPPSAQVMYDRMMANNNRRSMSSSSSSSGSMRSDKFVENFYSIGSKTPSPFSTVSTKDSDFIDFALAQYDYEVSDKGEIAFKEGDLLGIISKGEDGGEGWWEASVLNPKTQKIVRTGLVPSNFLETISK